jgi:hypothetical protein
MVVLSELVVTDRESCDRRNVDARRSSSDGCTSSDWTSKAYVGTKDQNAQKRELMLMLTVGNILTLSAGGQRQPAGAE